MKSFLAYCIFVLQVSEVVEAEQVNTPVDPDGEVQLFKEQTSTTQRETLLLFVHKYTVVGIELLTKHYLHKPECCLYRGGPRVGFLGFCWFLFILCNVDSRIVLDLIRKGKKSNMMLPGDVYWQHRKII